MRYSKYVILGGGITGATAHRKFKDYGIDSLLIEKNPKLGGHASSSKVDGYIFDEGPHIYFGVDEMVSNFIGAPKESQFDREARVGNLWTGKFLNHPAHLDFKSIDNLQIIDRIADDILKLDSAKVPRNYQEWLDYSIGSYSRKHFSDIYTFKYWRCHTSELDIDWIGNRVHKPSLKLLDSVRNSKELGELHTSDFTSNAHYLTKYKYHSQGFWSLFPKIHNEDFYQDEIVSVNLDENIVETKHTTISYEYLINTIPLVDLISKIRTTSGLQRRLSDLGSQLEWTSVKLMNFVIKSTRPIGHEFHWLYNYEPESEISRISFPDRFLNTPLPNVFRLQAEIYWNPKRESNPEINPLIVFDFLKQKKIIPLTSELQSFGEQKVTYANILPLKSRTKVMHEISREMSAQNIYLAGRYGLWQHLWSHESAKSAIETVENLLNI